MQVPHVIRTTALQDIAGKARPLPMSSVLAWAIHLLDQQVHTDAAQKQC